MASGSGDQPTREPAPHEHYGPLSLLRTHKDDGRSLILYERSDGAAADPPPGDGEAAGGPAGDGGAGGGQA